MIAENIKYLILKIWNVKLNELTKAEKELKMDIQSFLKMVIDGFF